MNAADALNAAAFALKRIVALAEEDEDNSLEEAGDVARSTLDELVAAGYVKEV